MKINKIFKLLKRWLRGLRFVNPKTLRRTCFERLLKVILSGKLLHQTKVVAWKLQWAIFMDHKFWKIKATTMIFVLCFISPTSYPCRISTPALSMFYRIFSSSTFLCVRRKVCTALFSTPILLCALPYFVAQP